MFEKFAEEYANNARTQKENEVIVIVDDWGVESLSPDERRLWQGISDRQKARKEGFLKGAEFVYNKVNDWHYHGIPHDNRPYLCKVVQPTNHDMTDLEILFYDDKDMSWFRWLTLWCGEEGNEIARINRKVIAWKEIVPPKERK